MKLMFLFTQYILFDVFKYIVFVFIKIVYANDLTKHFISYLLMTWDPEAGI